MKKPQDATIRNVQAANKWLARILEKVKDLEKRVKLLEKAVLK